MAEDDAGASAAYEREASREGKAAHGRGENPGQRLGLSSSLQPVPVACLCRLSDAHRPPGLPFPCQLPLLFRQVDDDAEQRKAEEAARAAWEQARQASGAGAGPAPEEAAAAAANGGGGFSAGGSSAAAATLASGGGVVTTLQLSEQEAAELFEDDDDEVSWRLCCLAANA